MNNRLMTVAMFGTSVEANLARNRLQEAGMKAFLADEETVNVWQLTNAFSGIKLQVSEQDAPGALAVLAEVHAADESASDEAQQPGEVSELDEDEPEPVLNGREKNADLACRAALVGILLWPLQLYASWLLLKVYSSDEPLASSKRRRAAIATAINLPMMFVNFLFAMLELVVFLVAACVQSSERSVSV